MSANSIPSLYRQLLKEANKFKDYNMRDYARRRVMIGFKGYGNGIDGMRTKESENELKGLLKASSVKTEEKALSVQDRIKEAKDALEMLRRQSVIQNLYYIQPNVMVSLRSKSSE